MKGYITQLGEGYLHGTFMILDIIVDYDEINENLGSLAKAGYYFIMKMEIPKAYI